MSLQHLVNRFRRFWSDENGQSTTEYILILAVVVMIAMKFREEFGQRLSDAVGRLGGQIDDAMSFQ